MWRRNGIGRLALAALALSVIGCGGSGGGDGFAQAPSNQTAIRYFNLSPDSTSLSFLLDGQTVATLGPNAQTASFANVNPGDYDLFLRDTGAPGDLDATAQILNGNTSYLFVAYGLVNFGDEFAKRLAAAVLTVDLSTPIGSKSRVIVFNGFLRETGFENVVIDFRDNAPTPQAPFNDLTFGESLTQDIDATTYTYEARLNDSDQVYASATQTFEPGSIYLALIGGVQNGTGDRAPQIRFIRLN